MRTLITGITGFTGSYVAQELSAIGWEVHGLSAHGTKPGRHFRVDLNNSWGLKRLVQQLRPEVVIHLAGIANVAHSDPESFYRVNTIGTRNLLAALAASDAAPECVIIASSANVYGNNPAARGPLTEDSPLNPSNDYAASKAAAELVARTWSERLPIIVTRPFNYTGAGQSADFLIPKIVNHFKQRKSTILLGNIDVWRDFGDVRTVAQAYRRLAETRPIGQTVNICSGEVHSLRQIIQLSSELTGHELHVEIDPRLVRSNEIKMLCGSHERLDRLVGKIPMSHLKETLRWMLDTEVGQRLMAVGGGQ